ncbi:hypothetical protein MPLA_680007 [Mesorhizobium sp. ORS 3359]|nr:hypothetical protein MPLA_680007 [Mesorhizobium sp. ORS 3359]
MKFIGPLGPLYHGVGLRDCRRYGHKVLDAPDEEGIAFRAERISHFDSRGFQSEIGILSIYTTEGLLDIALDAHAAYAILKAIRSIRSKLGLHKRKPGRKPGPGVKRERKGQPEGSAVP